MKPLYVKGVSPSIGYSCTYRMSRTGATIRCHFSRTSVWDTKGAWPCNCTERRLTQENRVWVEIILDERKQRFMVTATLPNGQRVGIAFQHGSALSKISETRTEAREATHCHLFELPEGWKPPRELKEGEENPAPILIADGRAVRNIKDPNILENARKHAITKALKAANFSKEARAAVWAAYHARVPDPVDPSQIIAQQARRITELEAALAALQHDQDSPLDSAV
jgi:hypothetical protein